MLVGQNGMGWDGMGWDGVGLDWIGSGRGQRQNSRGRDRNLSFHYILHIKTYALINHLKFNEINSYFNKSFVFVSIKYLLFWGNFQYFLGKFVPLLGKFFLLGNDFYTCL
jgi:hypothetical protein